MVSTANGQRVDASRYHLPSKVNWEKLTKLFTNLLDSVLAYSVFIHPAVTYISLRISFVLREHYVSYISLLHHRAHIISLKSLQLHHHTFLIKLTSITSLHLNYIICSKLITSPNSIILYTIIITLHHSHSITLSSDLIFRDSIKHPTFISTFHLNQYLGYFEIIAFQQHRD